MSTSVGGGTNAVRVNENSCCPAEVENAFAAIITTGKGVTLIIYLSHAGNRGTYGKHVVNKVASERDPSPLTGI